MNFVFCVSILVSIPTVSASSQAEAGNYFVTVKIYFFKVNASL